MNLIEPKWIEGSFLSLKSPWEDSLGVPPYRFEGVDNHSKENLPPLIWINGELIEWTSDLEEELEIPCPTTFSLINHCSSIPPEEDGPDWIDKGEDLEGKYWFIPKNNSQVATIEQWKLIMKYVEDLERIPWHQLSEISNYLLVRFGFTLEGLSKEIAEDIIRSLHLDWILLREVN